MNRHKVLQRVEDGDDVPARQAAGGMPWGQSSHVVQQLWFSVIRHDWRTLAIVPIAPGRAALEVANALGEVGGIHRRNPLVVFDALALELRGVAEMLQQLADESRDSERSLVAMESPLANLCGVPVARAADKVLLVIELGRADLASARKVMELIGPERIIGSVVLGGGAP